MDLFQFLQDWLRDIVLFNVDASTVAKTVGILAALTTLVQTIKKVSEGLQAVPLVNRIPFVKNLLDQVAHGQGPVIINILLTVAALGSAALSDNQLRGAEVWTIISAIGATVLGNDWMYRLLRGSIFPKPEAGSHIDNDSARNFNHRFAVPAGIPIADVFAERAAHSSAERAAVIARTGLSGEELL